MSEWISVKEKTPDVLDVRIRLTDGSVMENMWAQADGDYWSPLLKIFIITDHVTHWRPALEPPKIEP